MTYPGSGEIAANSSEDGGRTRCESDTGARAEGEGPQGREWLLI